MSERWLAAVRSLIAVVAASAVAALVVAACGSDDDELRVTGTVVAPPEAPPVDELPANARLTVTLEDVSRADAPSTVLSVQEIELADEDFPVPFEVPYEVGDIVEGNTYRVAARVTSSGDLLMISDTLTPVITRGAPTTDVELAVIYIADN
jgi:putative lipoprotein